MIENQSQLRLDLERLQRLGMVEAIWGEHKSVSQIAQTLTQLREAGHFGLVTRVSSQKANELKHLFVDLCIHKEAGCITLGELPPIRKDLGEVVVLSGGTSDLCVASEACLGLTCHGINCELLMDVGVAGLHRLLTNLQRLKKAKVLIACAGMEGALPTILAGLVPQPVIGVPVSVGYGVSAGGRTSLEGMLASCSPGLVVVNIDNGYGAAMAAIRILKS